MSSEDWDNDEPGYPRAPLPPHERTWRHPSELGELTGYQTPPARRIPRAALVGVGVVSVVLLAGVAQLLAPRGGSRVVSVASESIAVATTPQVTTTRTSSKRERTRAATKSQRPRRIGALTKRSKSLSTLMLADARRVAVAVGDGRHAFTVASALFADENLRVFVTDGVSVRARVVSVNSSANVAVLELERVVSGIVRQVAYDRPADGDHVMVGSGANDAYVRITPLGLTLETRAAANEGEPVVDERGKLVGLISRGADGSLQLVTIPRLAALQATVLVIDVWLGLSFHPDTLTVAEAQPNAPATLAGIQPGDSLTAINGAPLSCIDDLWLALAQLGVGQTVTLEYSRDGGAMSTDVTLSSRPS